MWLWLSCGIALLFVVTLAALLIRKVTRSPSLNPPDHLAMVSTLSSLATLALAVVVLGISIASYIDSNQSGPDLIKELQELQATMDASRKALDESVSRATQRFGDMQPKVASASHPAAQPTAKSASNNDLSQGELSDFPRIPPGASVLQVAALVREADALALAQALVEKKFPAFVRASQSDPFYRVQVGPYADAQSAKIARQQLETQGYKPIAYH